MTFVRKFSGDRSKPIVAVYTCPDHGEFDAMVERDANGEAPDTIPCPNPSTCNGDCMTSYRDGLWCGDPAHENAPDDAGDLLCVHTATWTPSPVVGRVRRVEVVRGKWEKPEQKTYLDTRELGEGQDPDDFWAKREKVWDDERHRMIKDELL